MITKTVGGMILERDRLVYVWLKGNDFIRVYNYASTQACFSDEFGYIPTGNSSYDEDAFTAHVDASHVKLKEELTETVTRHVVETTRTTYEHLAERKLSGLKMGNTTTVRRMQVKMDVIRASGILSEEEIHAIDTRFLAVNLNKK